MNIVPVYSKSTTYDIETGILLDWDEVPWNGPWERCKKGRGEQKQVTDAALANSKTDTARQGEQYGKENTGIDELTNVDPSSGLGMGAAGYLNNQKAAISQAYNNARSGVARANATRGFAGTPEGAFTSSINGANVGQAMDENKAFNDAQMLTRENMLQGLNLRSGLQAQYNPNAALNTASTSALNQSRMGSTLGDIGNGISTGVGLATSVAGLPKVFKSA